MLFGNNIKKFIILGFLLNSNLYFSQLDASGQLSKGSRLASLAASAFRPTVLHSARPSFCPEAFLGKPLPPLKKAFRGHLAVANVELMLVRAKMDNLVDRVKESDKKKAVAVGADGTSGVTSILDNDQATAIATFITMQTGIKVDSNKVFLTAAAVNVNPIDAATSILTMLTETKGVDPLHISLLGAVVKLCLSGGSDPSCVIGVLTTVVKLVAQQKAKWARLKEVELQSSPIIEADLSLSKTEDADLVVDKDLEKAIVATEEILAQEMSLVDSNPVMETIQKPSEDSPKFSKTKKLCESARKANLRLKEECRILKVFLHKLHQ